MTTIRLTFPWGRFYATPWGINASRLREPEWPPSPWRLLRALVSAWFRAHPGQTPSAECIALIELLGQDLPHIGIGKVSFGHTVHWQPNYGAAAKEDKADASYKNTRHENHFAAVSGPVFFQWQGLTLPPEHRRLLETLLAEITYFGRAESLCHVELADNEPSLTETNSCRPTDRRKISATCRDVFCPKPDDFEFADLWSKRGDPSRNTPDMAPPHLSDRLLATNMQADGGAWCSYQMPEGWPKGWVVRVPKILKTRKAPSEMPVTHHLRFSLQCRIPIPLKCTVDVAERFRQTAIKRFFEIAPGAHSFALTGHEPKPDHVVGNHQHAHFQPLPADGKHGEFIEDMHVWAACGFTKTEVEALMRVRTVHWGASKYPIRVVLTEISKLEANASSLAFQPASVWQSLTPYVPPRHFYRGNLHGAKLKEKDSPENQLNAELALCAIGCPIAITRIPLNRQDGHEPPHQADWDIVRAPGNSPAFDGGISAETHATHGDYERRIGFLFQVTFDHPRLIPRPLGHSSHFGLGLFIPADSASSF